MLELGGWCLGGAATQRVGRRLLETLDEVPVDTGPTSLCSASPEETAMPCAGLTCASHTCALCRPHLWRVPASPGMAASGRAGSGSGVGEAVLGPALSWHSDGCCRDPFSPVRWAGGALSRESHGAGRRMQEGFSSRGPTAPPPVRDSRVCSHPALCIGGRCVQGMGTIHLL